MNYVERESGLCEKREFSVYMVGGTVLIYSMDANFVKYVYDVKRANFFLCPR